jgi:hypothetical protein
LVVDRGTFIYARDPEERDRRRGTASHSTLQVDGAEQNRILPGRLFALPDMSRARIRWIDRRGSWELASGEHVGYARQGVVHRRLAALDGARAAAVLQDELIGSGAHLLEARLVVPHTSLVQRAATAEEELRLRELAAQGFDGVDASRCVALEGVALFAFGASQEFEIELEESDVSPGYGERAPATVVTVRLLAAAPARVATAVLALARPETGA